MSDSLSDLDPFTVHDPGCHCWPHVSESVVIAGAVDEYRASKATIAALRERRCDFECLICNPTASFPSNCDHMALIAYLHVTLDRLIDAVETWGRDATLEASEHLMDALATAKEAL